MKSFFFEQLESTSSLAQDWLRGNKEAPPFAIIARSQNSGRGRQGKTWASPPGNLYCSIAIDHRNLNMASMQTLSLKVGCIIAKWFEQDQGIGVTLKWPNDVLFSGRKLAGILCESIVEGNEIKSLVVGVGININTSPQTEDQEAICLAEILNTTEQLDIQELADRFLKFWNQNCQSHFAKSAKEDAEAFTKLSMDLNQDWIDCKTSETFHYLGLSATGELKLAAKDGTVINIQSAHHDYSWIYQQKTDRRHGVWVMDIGNSRIKIAKFSNRNADLPEATWQISIGDSWEKQIPLQELQKSSANTVFYISVNPNISKSVGEFLKEKNIRLTPLRKRRIYSRHVDYPIDQLGSDRLCAIEAAIRYYDRRRPKIVVCAGTATTIDCISADRRHLGGWIIPGCELFLRALSDNTALLPQVVIDDTTVANFGLGCDTKSAMAMGVIAAQRGAVSAAYELLRKFDDGEILLIYTGGFATLLQDRSNEHSLVDSDLILRGVKILTVGGV